MFIVEGVAHRVAEDVFGAAKDGSAKVFVVAQDLAFHRGRRRSSWRKDGSVKVFIVAQDLAFHRSRRRSSRGGGRFRRREGREREGARRGKRRSSRGG